MKMIVHTPPETIVRTDFVALALNPEKLGIGSGKKRIVNLACGHSALTSAINKMICPRCTEMLRRSIAGEDADYESYRKGKIPDQMAWPEDPCRLFNEPHEPYGKFTRD